MFAMFMKANNNLRQDWVTTLTQFHAALCTQFDLALHHQDLSLWGFDTTVDDSEAPGPTPYPTAPWGTDLPSPAVFPPGFVDTQCFTALPGRKEHHQQAELVCNPVPFPAAGPERLCW